MNGVHKFAERQRLSGMFELLFGLLFWPERASSESATLKKNLSGSFFVFLLQGGAKKINASLKWNQLDKV